MEELEFLINMTYLVLTAGLCSIVFNKLKMPPIIGYLLAGVLLANVLEIPASSESIISILSDIGLVMLMFCIGMELNLDKLKRDGRFAMIVAMIQLPVMMITGYSVGTLMGYSSAASIALGAIISGSSTAVLLAVLSMQERISRETIETLVLVTVIEDIGQVIIMSMITPVFAGSSMEFDQMAILIISIVVFMLVSIVAGIKIVPRCLDWVGDNTSAEVLLMVSIGICFLMSYLAVVIGMSMAIGAFLMGVILSQSKFSREVGEKVEPMKEVFMAIFFISIGMKVTIQGFIDNIGLAIVIFVVFLVSKVVAVFLGYFAGNRSYPEAFVCALSMTSMGEFAFIISEEAYSYGVISNGFYTAVIGAAIISMVVLPLSSKGMFPVVDYVNEKQPRLLCAAGSLAYSVRADIYDKLDSDRVGAAMRKSMRNAYFCIFLMFVIEILFVNYSSEAQRFLTELLMDQEYLGYVSFLLINFFVLAVPTTYLVRSIKFIDRVLEEASSGLMAGRDARIREKFYKGVGMVGVPFIVCIIDFVILALVPGPFGSASSLVIIPIVIAIVALRIFVFNRRKDAAEEGPQVGTQAEQEDNAE